MNKQLFKKKVREQWNLAMNERADVRNVLDLRLYIDDCLDGIYNDTQLDELYDYLEKYKVDWFIDIYENIHGENNAVFTDHTIFASDIPDLSPSGVLRSKIIKEMQENPTAAVAVVRFDDLDKIGHTRFNGDGKLHILTHPTTAGIESILLRNILSIKGYFIVSEQDFIWEDGTIDIEFVTDMPYEKTN